MHPIPFLTLLLITLMSMTPLKAGANSSLVDFAKTDSTQPLNVTSFADISVQDAERNDLNTFVFSPIHKDDLSYPYTDKAIWIRLAVHNSSQDSIEKILYFSSGITGTLELYTNGMALRPDFVSGSAIPFLLRPIHSQHAGFRVQLNPGEGKTLYIKRTSQHNLSSRVILASESDLLRLEAEDKSVIYFYLGGITCLVIYNLLIGLFTRDKNYFYYGLFASTLAATAINTLGIWDAYLIHSDSISITNLLLIFSSICLLATLNFVYHFLNIPEYLPKAKLGFWLLAGTTIACLTNGIVPLRGGQLFFGLLNDLTILSGLIFLVICGWLVLARGYLLAKYFLLSWVPLGLAILVWFSARYGLLPNTDLAEDSLMLGNMGEMLILSFGLGYKINVLDQEKKQALRQAEEKVRYHRLVKILSHDIANSLLIFSGYLVNLRSTHLGQSEEAIFEKVEHVIKNIRDVLGLVRSEVALSSFYTSAQLVPVNLCEVVREIVALYDDQLRSKCLDLEIDLPEKIIVQADRTALSNQVIANVISNSMKFSYPNSKIEIKASVSENRVQIDFRDFGVGMSKEEIAKVFFKGQASSKEGTLKERGTGLGTSLIKDYMKIFNGEITVTSIPKGSSSDSGTTISLFFPVSKS